MPDWHDGDGYPELLSSEGWAWQFLRRNPEYRQDYEKFRAEYKKLQDKDQSNKGPKGSWLDKACAWQPGLKYEPPAKQGRP